MERDSSKNKNVNSSRKDAKGKQPESSHPRVIQAPYGRVEGAGVLPQNPKGWRRIIEVCDADPDTITYYENLLVYTTQPPQFLGTKLEDVPDGWVECLINTATKRRILSAPGYPQPILRPPQVRHEVRESELHGLGLFAKEDIPLGSLVLSERPMVIASSAIIYMGDEDLRSFPKSVQVQVILRDREDQLKILFKRMPRENQRKYLRLHNSHQFDGSGVLLGRMRTNSFGLPGLSDMDEASVRSRKEVNDKLGTYSGVFDVLSRINHSCCPNITYHFHPPSLSMRVYASRDIKAGEELFISYIPSLLLPKSQRAAELAPYDITCTCPACTSSSISDINRLALATATISPNTNLPASQSLQDRREAQIHLLELVEKEGLYGQRIYNTLLTQITASFLLDADVENSMKYGKKHARVADLEIEKYYAGGEEEEDKDYRVVRIASYEVFCDPEEVKTIPSFGQREENRLLLEMIRIAANGRKTEKLEELERMMGALGIPMTVEEDVKEDIETGHSK